MVRVLQIVDNLSYDSGVSSFLMNIYRNIDKNKIQFDFLVASKRKESYEHEINSLGGNVFYFGNPFSIKSVINANCLAKAFFKLHVDEYVAFHLHTSTMSLFTLRHIKRFGGQRRIVHSHSSMTSNNKVKALINYILNRFVKPYANCYVACSSEAADFLYGKYSKMRKEAVIICNAVNTSDFYYDVSQRKQLRKRYKIQDEAVLLHVSNFSKIKNTDFLANVITKSAKLNKQMKFVFVGDGPERKRFQDVLMKSNLENRCIFTGRISDVINYFNLADLFLLPSIKEGLPVTAVEAQACGLPCLLSETITKECSSGNVAFLPLVENIWIRYICGFTSLNDDERSKCVETFQNSHLTIENAIQKIENLYGDNEI